MEGTRGLCEFRSGLCQVLAGHELTFGVDDGRALLPLGLGLLGHGADHGLGELDIFELDGLDVDTPISRVFVDDREDFGGDFFALRQELIEGSLTGDPAHGGLGELEHGVVDIFDFVDGFGGIGDFVVDHRVHFAGHVVFGDCVLLGDVDGLGTNIDFAETLKNRDDQFPPGGDDIAKATHGINYAALVFVDLFEGDEDDENNQGDKKFHTTSNC